MRTIRTRGPIVRKHPLTGLPVLPIGTRRDGSLIWPIMGGSGEGDEGGEGGDEGGTGGDAGKTGDEEGKTDEGKATDAEKVEDLPAWAQKIIRESRDGEAKARTAKTAAADEARKELLSTIAKAIGGDDGKKPATVEELTQQLTEQTGETEAARADARDTKAELIVWRNAAELKVDPQALTDSRAFASAIQNLDPSDPKKFETAVKKAAQEAAEKNPKLAAVQAAGSSSADHGGPGGGASKTPKPLDAAVGGHYGT